MNWNDVKIYDYTSIMYIFYAFAKFLSMFNYKKQVFLIMILSFT